MAEIDSSIYSRSRPPDILGSVQRGLSMRDMIDQRARTQELDERRKKTDAAYTGSIVKNPDGTTSFDNQKLLSGLAGVGGQEFLEGRTKIQAQDLAAQEAKQKKALADLDMAGRLFSPVKDQSTYDMAMKGLADYGIDTSRFSRVYNPQEVQFNLGKAMTAKEQLQAQMDQLNMKKTQAEIGKINAEAGKVRNERSAGKQLSASEVLKVNEGNAIPTLLTDVSETISQNPALFSPGVGTARSINPWDTQAQTADAQLRTASQAFGRFMEGGVLRKEDEDKYRKMFPKLGDTKEVAANKLALIQRQLINKQKSDLDALKASGYNTSGVSAGANIPVGQVPSAIRNRPAPSPGLGLTANNPPAVDFNSIPDDQLLQMYLQAGGK